MGMLVDGKWTDEDRDRAAESGEFRRIASIFRDRISADGSSGFKVIPNRPKTARTMIWVAQVSGENNCTTGRITGAMARANRSALCRA